ncbi:MAG: hypothetical protein ACI8ZM_002763 [Crocinitomix sp.]|jgi:hypothetical protein
MESNKSKIDKYLLKADANVQIRAEIDLIELEVKSIEAQIKETSSPRMLQTLEIQLKRTIAFQQKTENNLAANIASGTQKLRSPSIYGSEVTQGLSGYELVAGKDTLVRVFLGYDIPVIKQTTASIQNQEIIENQCGTNETKSIHFDFPLFDLPKIGVAHLDFVSLRIRGPKGIDIEIPGDLGDGKFDQFSKSHSAKDNANFYIDGTQFPVSGNYRFDVQFFRKGLLVGTHKLKDRSFHKTKDLRVLIIVDTWAMPIKAWNTLFESLQYVQRNFPIRSKIGPLDGDQTVGLRYKIIPKPFDVDFPSWTPVRRLLDEFNASQEKNGKPDRAEHILTVRVQQENEPQRGGVGESGPGGRVSGVTLNVNPPANDVFATLICQEIGHNFLGSLHSPSPDIDDIAAFNLKDRKAINSPRSVMFGFYTGNRNTDSFFIPADWKKIRLGLLEKNATGPS